MIISPNCGEIDPFFNIKELGFYIAILKILRTVIYNKNTPSIPERSSNS